MNGSIRTSKGDDEDWESVDEHATGGYTEDDFDYDEYVEREFPFHSAGQADANWKKWIWRIVVIVICLLLIWRFLLF